MASNEPMNTKIESKLIMCKNCRQDILEEKMFLHEGFCLRNNVYCEHCEKVFLKKDYEEHIKNIPKNQPKQKTYLPSESPKSSDSNSEPKKPNLVIEEIEEINKNTKHGDENFKTISPTPCLEYVQMPMTELFQINTPIIIENGQIISNKNKNEFLLPQLGIDTIPNSKMGDEVLDEIINQGEIFKENNNISRNSYNIDGLKSVLNRYNLNSKKIISNNSNKKILKIYNSSSIDDHKIFSGKKNFNLFNQENKNKSGSFINNFNNSKVNKSNIINLNDNNLNKDNNSKNNSIIINNNIITYNANKNISKIHNFYNFQQTPQKPLLSNTLKKNSFWKNAFENNQNSIKSSHNIKKNNSFNNNFENNFLSGKKELKDSNIQNKNIRINTNAHINTNKNSLSGQKIKSSISFKPQSAKPKINIIKKRCQFCNNIFYAEKMQNHYKYCKEKLLEKGKNKDIKKFFIQNPIKSDKTLPNRNSIIRNSNMEVRNDEDRKRMLDMQFNDALMGISINNEIKKKRGVISNEKKMDNYNRPLNNDNRIHLKKNLYIFNENEHNIENNKFFNSKNKEIHSDHTPNGIYEFKRNANNKDLNKIDIIYVDKTDTLNEKNPFQHLGPNISNISTEEIDPWLFFKSNYRKDDGNSGSNNRKKNKDNNKIFFENYEEWS